MNLVPLDIKLGFRMVAKYPGLTVVGGLAMAFAIWVGAVTFNMVTLFTSPSLSLPGGDRIVQLQNWDLSRSEAEPRSLRDFLAWQSSLASVTDLGAWRDINANLRASDNVSRPVTGAEITASAFTIAPAAPLMGRVLNAADEAAGAPAVVLLGYELWKSRFNGDPRVLGRSVQLGDGYATVVGVMPEGFAFPVYHELWTPLRAALYEHAPREGPSITVFGRLAPGATIATAQTELALLGQRAAAEFPGTHEHLQPRVTPYARLFYQPAAGDFTFIYAIHLFAFMLVALVCGNVALLMFARAASRENELVVRSALGASRRRITLQFFTEALVLNALAAVIGLAAAAISLKLWGKPYLELNLGKLPFWYDVSLSPMTVVYGVGLTLLGAVVAGVVPALKATHGLGQRLREGSSGGGGIKFGGIWTAVIITQVAVTVAFPAIAFVQQRELLRIRGFDNGFAANEYLGARLEIDSAGVSGALHTLQERLANEPGVSGVTFVDQLPRLFHREYRIELDGVTYAAGESPEVATASIAPNYFDVLESPVIAGRAFNASDVGTRTAIVDQGFVAEVLKGQNPIGRRFAFQPPDGTPADAPRDWYEIIGVANDLGMQYVTHQHRTAGLYLPWDQSSTSSLYLMIHAPGDPMALGSRVREIVAQVDPTLRLTELIRADRVTDGIQWFLGLWIRITVVLMAIALLLSLAGIYAVLAFTVAKRTREIGVRVALGASRQRVVAEIFRRPLTQVAIGVAAGGLLVGAGAIAMAGSLSAMQVLLLVTYIGVMLAVCMLACIVPTRRALSVEPTEALRGE